MTKLTYKDAGVDIASADATLDRAREAIRASFTPGVLADVGLFGGLFDPGRVGAAGQVLVASADGVGTKMEVARRVGIFGGVGRDLVNHCVNDVLVQGARPLFFLDYVAMGKLEPDVAGALVEGCAEACRENGLALLGGETAEMPGVYRDGDAELVGFLVGSVPRERLLDGSRVRAGQVLLALRSSGLHTNGYSLARRVVFDVLGWELDERPPELDGATIGEALLAVHRSYLVPLLPLLDQGRIAALAHITGGGLRDNVRRVLSDTDAVVDLTTWEPPPLFRLLVEHGGLERDEAYRAFNMGVGMVIFVDPEERDGVLDALRAAGEDAFEIGRVEAGSGEVRYEP